MEPLSADPASRWSHWFNGSHIVRFLELVQDLIVISLCIGLFSFMVMQSREMFLSLLPPLNCPEVTADILFLLILVELFRLLIIYLKEHRVSIGVAVEVSIVSVLREIILWHCHVDLQPDRGSTDPDRSCRVTGVCCYTLPRILVENTEIDWNGPELQLHGLPLSPDPL